MMVLFLASPPTPLSGVGVETESAEIGICAAAECDDARYDAAEAKAETKKDENDDQIFRRRMRVVAVFRSVRVSAVARVTIKGFSCGIGGDAPRAVANWSDCQICRCCSL